MGGSAMTIRQDREIRLCPVVAEEADLYAYWMTHGQWRQFDAPWAVPADKWEPEALSKFKERFLQTASRQHESVSKCTLYHEENPIGWLNSYRADEASVYVGIDICLDKHLGRGLGTRALRLWIDYWFRDRDLHRVGLETWSFNERMMRVAEKCGFVHEGIVREAQWWDGAWRDLHMFGILETEHLQTAENLG